jgi:hypothetical protein
MQPTAIAITAAISITSSQPPVCTSSPKTNTPKKALISASPRVSGGWTATSEPACRPFCSRNSAPTPATAAPYSCQEVKNGSMPSDRAAIALFSSVAVSA